MATARSKTWQDVVQSWGISEQVIKDFGLTYLNHDGRGGVVYGAESCRQRIAFLQGEPKYKWLTSELPMQPFYHLVGLRHSAGGTLYIVNGEKAVWAMATAGIVNSVSTFGELNIDPLVAAIFAAENPPSKITVIPDCDDVGIKAALKWNSKRQLFKESGIELVIDDLRKYFNDHHNLEAVNKYDIRDMWLLINQDKAVFTRALEHAFQAIDLTELTNITPLPVPKQFGNITNDKIEEWIQSEVAPKTGAVIGKKKKVTCPDPAHEDKHPSFRISIDTGFPVPQCTCGIQDEKKPWTKIAEWVNAKPFGAWLAEQTKDAPKPSKPRKQTGKTEIAENINLDLNETEATRALFGAIMRSNNYLDDIIDDLNEHDFQSLKARVMWSAMVAIHNRGEAIDRTTLTEQLRQSRKLDTVGLDTIQVLKSYDGGGAVKSYAAVISRRAAIRRGAEAGDKITQLYANAEIDELDEISNQAEMLLLSATNSKTSRRGDSLGAGLGRFYDRLEFLQNSQDAFVGISTGWGELDKLLLGLQKGDLYILGSRPGMGKTSAELNMAVEAARNGSKVVIFSLEMSEEQLVQRIVSTETGINTIKFRTGHLTDAEMSRFVNAVGTLGQLPLHIDDTPGLNIIQLRKECRRLKREQGLDLIIVDYLQLMNGVGKSGGDNRVQEISRISRGLKELARELNVPILAGSQLSRKVEERKDKRPILSDLRESGSIEQDADVVIFIYRDDQYDLASLRPNEADFIVAKHRNGATGTATLYFKKHLTQFTNLVRTKVNLENF